MDVIIPPIVYLISIVIGFAIMFFVIKAAVAQGIKDALWNFEVAMRNAVKNGVQEALQETEKNKSEEHHG